MQRQKLIPSFLICVFVGGCYGKTPPDPLPGGAGPFVSRPVLEIPSHHFDTLTPLPALMEAHHRQLVAQAHTLPPDLARQFADTEISALQRRFSGREEQLRSELLRRLRPPVAQPIAPNDGDRRKGLYPKDDEAAGASARKARP